MKERRNIDLFYFVENWENFILPRQEQFLGVKKINMSVSWFRLESN